MAIRRHRSGGIPKRRTTLTLPVDSLTQAERIARARKVNLSTVISEAISEGLRAHAAVERSEHVLNAYKKAFSGFTDDEMAILDGIILEPASRR
jgi:post-segregation antitoxin (ccd killing protein)